MLGADAARTLSSRRDEISIGVSITGRKTIEVVTRMLLRSFSSSIANC